VSRRVSLRASAVADIEYAHVWYEEQRPGLGAGFVGQVDAVLESLRDHPEAHAVVESGIRRALLRRFPYGVFYVVEREAVVVLAVLHQSRDPGAWRDRA
jgi:toxin ParE1/3/4